MEEETKISPVPDILKNIVDICSSSKTVDPQSEAPLLSRSLCIICHHLSEGHLTGISRQPISAREILVLVTQISRIMLTEKASICTKKTF